MLSFNFKCKIIFFFFLFLLSDAQDFSFQPEPIKTTLEYRKKLDAKGALQFNISALKQYEESNNTKGIIMAYTNIGSLLNALGRHRESLEYLDKAKKELLHSNDPFLKANLYNEYGRTYTLLGLYEQSNAAFDQAKPFIKKIRDIKQREFAQGYNYSWQQQNLPKDKNLDSLQAINKKIMGVKPTITSYTRTADQFIDKKTHLDSAEYYMNKALALSEDASDVEKATALFSYGDLFNVKGDKEKALEYYLKSLDLLQKTENTPTALLTVYDTLSSVYKSLNEIDKSNEYLRKYTILNDDINKNEKEAINLAVNKLIELNYEEKKQERKLFYLIVLTILLACIGIMYFIQTINNKNKLKKDALIKEKTMEAEALKLKVNDSFDEIIQLMERRNPLFLKRFKEVYPEFYEKLIKHTPELTEHDIKFCAYLRLNLNNKEICRYEHLSLRGIETKRYRLKKKLKLPKNIELHKWILDL
ncbi:hypothetical protein LXM63_00335 [Chryseobacterium gleum]|uniref:tetratricopeptide repeat protein n=1 Tax=Chryseobacterium gleum TaxID=250 RepID=UPI001E43B69B|nr:tetratricopeptide repeat protein [Chryseobacterium gleum]MCE4063529.1 hypothetical protein [Chryseobacterium gleum]